jgi:hypothetical protein
MKNLNQDNRSSAIDLNPGPPEQKVGVLNTEPWSSPAPGLLL